MVDSVLRVIVDGRPAADGSQVVIQAINNMARASGSAKTEVASLQNQLSKFKDIGSSLGGFLKSIIPLDALIEAGRAIYNVTNRLQGFISTMSVVTGTAQEARDELNYLVSVSNRWGVSLDSLIGPYAKMAAAAKGTALAGENLRNVFESITMASSAMHLSSQDTTLVFFALQQMVSKGKVSMEELRKQLAERFPGAVQLAADALGVTVDQMEKMVRAGKVMTDDFLPKFAKKIEEAFSGAAQVSSKSLLSEINRLQTAWEVFLIKISESSVIAAASETMKIFTGILTDNSGVAYDLGDVIAGLIRKFNEFIGAISQESMKNGLETIVSLLGAIAWGVETVIQVFSIFSPMLRGFGNLVSEYLATPIKAMGAAISFIASIPAALAKAHDTHSLTAFSEAWDKATESINLSAEANKRYGESNLDARDRQVLLIKSNEEAITVQQKMLQNNLAQVEDNKRVADQTLKRVSAVERLNEVTANRTAIMKQFNEQDTSTLEGLKNANKLLSQYNATEKDFIAASKAAAAELKSKKGHIADYTAEIAKLDDKIVGLAEQGYPNLARAYELYVRNQAAGKTSNMEEFILLTKKAKALDEQNIQMKENNDILKQAIDLEDQKVKKDREEIDSMLKVIESLREQNKQYEIEHMFVGQAGVEKQKYIVMLKAEEERLKGNISAMEEYIRQYDLLVQKQADDEMLSFGQSLSSQFKDIENGLADALMRGFEDGKGFAENFKDTLLNMFKSMILKPVIQGVMSPFMNAAMGAFGYTQNSNGAWVSQSGGGFGSLGGFGGLGAFFSQNPYTNPGFVGPPTEGQYYMNQAGAYVGSALMGYGIGGAAHSMFGNDRNQQGMQIGGAVGGIAGYAALGASVGGPWGALIGAIVGALAGSLIKSGGGPKSGGYGYAGDITPWNRTDQFSGSTFMPGHFTPNDQDPSMGDAARSWTKLYDMTVKGLGGTAGSRGFDIGYYSDPKGTTDSAMGIRAFVNGKQAYNYWSGESLGRDGSGLEAAITLETRRALVGALQQSDLPDAIAAVFNTVTASALTNAQIDNLLAYTGAMATVIKAISGSVTEDAAALWADSQRTSVQVLRDMGDEVIELSQNMDGTTESMQDLATATTNYRDAVVKLLADINRIKTAMSDMFGGTLQNLNLVGLDNDAVRTYWTDLINNELTTIAATDDPYVIEQAGQNINRYVQNVIGTFSDEELLANKNPLIDWVTGLNAFVQQNLTRVGAGIVEDTENPLAAAGTAMGDAATKFQSAATAQESAAQVMYNAAQAMAGAASTFAAQMPIKVTATIVDSTQVGGG